MVQGNITLIFCPVNNKGIIMPSFMIIIELNMLTKLSSGGVAPPFAWPGLHAPLFQL